VGPDRLARFFVRAGASYRASKSIREMIVFAAQNVLKDPPFTRLDLISCRNLLIYLNPDLQQRLLPVLHYALKPGGILMLGTSETVGESEDLFEPLDRKWRLFARLAGAPVAVPAAAFKAGDAGASRVMRRAVAASSSPGAAIEKALLERFAPPTAIVNERGDIAYLHGRTGSFLEPSSGEPKNNLYAMAREGLELELPALVRVASDQGREVARRGLSVRTNGDVAEVNLLASPILEPESIRGLIRVSFETTQKPAPGKKSRRRSGGRTKELELELQHTRETLQSTIEEQQSTNEELQSANEELQSTNEELQSANEELETSREELQSLNEELQTVNSELLLKNDALAHSNDDMQNLLQSTDIATLFLDTDLKIKRFTSQAREVINLIPGDMGRPLADLSTNIRYDRLAEDAARVLDTLVPQETEVQTTDGAWRLIRMLPYRTSQNVIDGVVITVIDIDRIKRAEALAASRAFAESIVHTVREPLVVLDPNLAVVTANHAFFDSFGFDAGRVTGRRLVDLPGGEFWALPELRTLLEEVASKGRVFEDFEVVHELPGIGPRRLLLNARRLEAGSGSVRHILLALEIQSATVAR
jgi:two-component system CheB/CheR fusion protein